MTISACFGVDAADGVNGELLDDAVDRGDEASLALALAGFDNFLREFLGFFAGGGEAVVLGAFEFGEQGFFLALIGVERLSEFFELAALGGKIALGFDASLFFFQIAVFGDEVFVGKVFVVAGALGDQRQGLFEFLDLFLRAGAFGLFAGGIAASLANPVALRVEFGVCGQNGGAVAMEGFQQRLGASEFEAGFDPGGLVLVGFSAGEGAIKFHQQLPGFDVLAIAHMNGFDHTRFQRLNHLAALGDNEFAGGGGDNINLAQTSPQHRDQDKSNQRPQRDAGGGMGRGFLQLKRGRQEGAFIRAAIWRYELPAHRPCRTPHLHVATA